MQEARARLRVAESVDEVDHLGSELDSWLADATEIGTYGQYRSQLETLSAVLRPVLRETRRYVVDLDPHLDTGTVYDECRRADRRVVFLRRLWQWFAFRFEQRRDNRLCEVLSAADEVVWSCWAQTWQLTGAGTPGPAPLPYVDPQFSASTTPRVDMPADLRAASDATLAAQIRAMPIPVIALPARVTWRPWWLVLLAHETGHQVQYELSPGADQPARDLVGEAAARAGSGEDEQERWRGWAVELFADAYAAAMVGPSIAWAVDELEYRAGDGLLRSPAPTYPPPVVRMALLDALTDAAARPTPERVAGTGPLAADVAALLCRVPAIAGALQAVPVAGATLSQLAARAPAWRRSAAIWRGQLLAEARPRPVTTVEAARLCVAGGVGAWRALALTDDGGAGADRLRSRLLEIVPACQPIGIRAAAPTGFGTVDATTRSLLDAVFSPAVQEVPE